MILYNTDQRTNFVFQKPWILFVIYKKVGLSDSLTEYFRVLHLQNGLSNWLIDVEYFVLSNKVNKDMVLAVSYGI